MWKSTGLSRVFLGFALWSAAACRPVPVRPPQLAPLPKAQVALERLRLRANQLRGLQSMGRVTYFGEKGRLRLKTVILAQRPDKFRIETLSPLEQPLQVMVSDGTRLSLLADGQFYEGESTAQNVARILPVPLSPSDLVDALLSGVPMDPRFQAEGIEWLENSDALQRLTLVSDASGQIILDFDVQTMTVRRLLLPARGPHPEVLIRFERFEDLPGPAGLALARRIKLKLSNASDEVTLKLKDVATNVGIRPHLFVISPPSGLTPIKLDVAPDRPVTTP
jgi:outer membrane lipoprotein-sorting protein